MKTNKTTNPAIDYSNMPRLKAFHSVNYGGDFTQRKIEGCEQYANVTDMQLKRAPRTTQEGAARDMITMIERAEQSLIRANPPINCKGYVERADYSIMSLYSDYKDKIEYGLANWSDYRAERKKWCQCRYMYCLNMFPIERDNFKRKPAKRKDARYCCDDCRVAQKDADKRYKATGSYLPVYYYMPKLTETVNDEARLYESATAADEIERQIDKRKTERPVKMKRTDGGGTRGGVIKKYKSLAEAEKGYAEQDRTGWTKIS
ncbi:hypothetical protein [Sporosarcina aquimarina]|uniref:Uncharacterized protein n=1 Tax=Sporosarcina aquimarina TaxID=114975 RepID=A0ABU4G0F2_9BACL|nr:hypothetical protein [Sporosarcina aquimarina]MDW0110444.1 hypothetical protein [Sporosarcina aquimarina]